MDQENGQLTDGEGVSRPAAAGMKAVSGGPPSGVAEPAGGGTPGALATLFDVAPLGVLVMDRKGRVLSANPAFEKLIGAAIPAGDTSLDELVHPDERWRVRSTLNDLVIGSRRRTGVPTRLLRGEEAAVAVHLDIHRTGGEDDLLLAVVEDVSATRRAREDARAAEERFRALVESSPLAVITVDADDAITFFNTAAEVTFGYELGEVLHESIANLFSSRGMRALGGTADGDAPVVEVEARRKDGSVFPVEAAAARWSTEEGIFRTIFARDISERRATEMALAGHVRTLTRINDDLKAFSRVATQDLQPPVRHLSRHLQALSDGLPEDHELRPHVDAVADAAASMRDTLEGAVAYVAAASRQLRVRPVDAQRAFEEALRVLGLLVEETGAVVEARLPRVLADEDALTQMFVEILDNALRAAADAPPRVEATARVQGERVHILVRDHGRGLPRHDQEDAFRMYQKFDGDASPGPGVGLTVVRHLVERMDGAVRLEGEAGEGLTVVVTLPRAD